MSLLRVHEARPRPGYIYPLTRADIHAALAFFGPECRYGLHSITLIHGGSDLGCLRFGALLVPGRVVLYDQPSAPWTLPGMLSVAGREQFAAAGASITDVGGGAQTVVAWPGDTLHRFFLFDVLMHEIGHHVLQHETGKRADRIARTRDHEAFALRFARLCRLRWEAVYA